MWPGVGIAPVSQGVQGVWPSPREVRVNALAAARRVGHRSLLATTTQRLDARAPLTTHGCEVRGGDRPEWRSCATGGRGLVVPRGQKRSKMPSASEGRVILRWICVEISTESPSRCLSRDEVNPGGRTDRPGGCVHGRLHGVVERRCARFAREPEGRHDRRRSMPGLSTCRKASRSRSPRHGVDDPRCHQ